VPCHQQSEQLVSNIALRHRRSALEANLQHQREHILALLECGVCLSTSDQGFNDVVELSPHRREAMPWAP
jgi:hypothetical protein